MKSPADILPFPSGITEVTLSAPSPQATVKEPSPEPSRAITLPHSPFSSVGVALFIFSILPLRYAKAPGIGLFAVATLFELVTLPCEFNASRRAMEALSASGWYSRQELRGSRKVLTAAALTYVAALAVSLIQLLRLVLSLNRRKR